MGSHKETNLFEEPAFLDDIRNGLLPDATGFVDILESIEFL